MGLFDGLEKLINEHGSAVILKERISLANDKYAALEREKTALQSEKAALQAENDTFRIDNSKLKEQIRNLEAQLKKPVGELSEIETNILVYLAKVEEADLDHIAANLKVHPTRAKFHLETLDRNKYIHTYYSTDGSTYCLIHLGNEYLVVKNLI